MRPLRVPEVVFQHWMFLHTVIPARYIAATNSKVARVRWKEHQLVETDARHDLDTLAAWHKKWPD